jgi:hypothetical protein
MSGALEILKYNNIPAEEWQMGTTKVFIRHPETVSLIIMLSTSNLTSFYRFLRLKTYVISTGITWLPVFSVPGVPMLDTELSALKRFNVSGDKTNTISVIFKCANMAIKSWAVKKNVVDSHLLV